MADIVELALLHQSVDAGAADAEAAGRFTRRELGGFVERVNRTVEARRSRFPVHTGCRNGYRLAAPLQP
jgi:hypothetical protein